VIAYPTVFVLGAGASMPYGFPSGAELLAEAKRYSADSLLKSTCERMPMGAVRSFAQMLKLSQDESLDALLEHRPESDVKVGKLFMAAQLLSKEHDDMNGNPRGRPWFNYLFTRMAERVDSIGNFVEQNKVTFVTYNYDRLLEYKLTNGLHTHYTAPVAECAKALEHIKVIHLHGSLGTLYGGQSDVPYGCRRSDAESFEDSKCQFISEAADAIQIVHQADPNTPEFRTAREALGQAERVFFLGFSFGQQNVDRLGFQHIKKTAQIRLSSFGMASGEYDVYVRQPLSKFQLPYTDRASRADGNENWDCRTTLEEHIGAIVRRYD